MKCINRVICAAVAASMLVSIAGCKDKDNKVDSPDQPADTTASLTATGDLPSAKGETYRIGSVTFSTEDTELQLGDVTFTDADLKFISKCKLCGWLNVKR